MPTEKEQKREEVAELAMEIYSEISYPPCAGDAEETEERTYSVVSAIKEFLLTCINWRKPDYFGYISIKDQMKLIEKNVAPEVYQKLGGLIKHSYFKGWDS